MLEYNCALITSVLSNPQKIYEYLAECKKNGIKVVPPNVNRSKTAFHAEQGAIVFGLGAIKNLGTSFCDALVLERERNGDFADFDDFVDRMRGLGMNKRQLEALIKSGSMDCLGVFRSRMLAVYESVMEYQNSSSLAGQNDMFNAGSGDLSALKTEFPNVPEFSAAELLKLERESSGMFLTGHLLDDYRENAALIKSDSISAVLQSFVSDGDSEGIYKDQQKVTVVGIISSRTNKATRAGEPMAFVTVDGGDASIEALIFPKVLSEYTHFLMPETAVAVEGRISQRDDEEPKILASRILKLSKNGTPPAAFEIGTGVTQSSRSEVRVKKAPAAVKLYLKVPSFESPLFKRLKAFIEIFGGPCPVVVYDAASCKASKLSSGGVLINDFTMSELSELLGRENVVLK